MAALPVSFRSFCIDGEFIVMRGGEHIRDQIISILILLQSTECHLCAGNILLWVLEVLKLFLLSAPYLFEEILELGDGTYQSVVVPFDSLGLVGIRVRVALDGTSVAAEKTVKVRTDLVSLALAQGVALSTSSLEEVGTLLCVT